MDERELRREEKYVLDEGPLEWVADAEKEFDRDLAAAMDRARAQEAKPQAPPRGWRREGDGWVPDPGFRAVPAGFSAGVTATTVSACSSAACL